MNKPTLTAYSVRDFKKSSGEVDASWKMIGVGFWHKDAGGWTIELDALPVNGRVVVRVNKDPKK